MEGPLKANRFSAVFPELRQKAIDEAHAALLSTTPTQTDPSNSKAKAKRRQTTHGRLEGSGGQDVYAFNVSDNDDFHPGSGSKKRKRPPPENKDPRLGKNEGYEEGTRSSKKKPTKRAKSTGGGMSVLDLLNDTSEDDWRPNTSNPPTSGRKSTRGNTVHADLLPPLPKTKRKSRDVANTVANYDPQQFDGNLSLGFNHSDDPSNARSAEIQVAGTEPTSQTVPSTFMIDLTRKVLQNERRAEYDAISPELSTSERPLAFGATSPGGVYSTPDLGSTIPDPPYDPNLPPSQVAAYLAEAYHHIPEPHPLAPPSVASDSPLSSLENSPAKPAKKKPKERKRAATDQHLGLVFSPDGDHGFGSFPIASEWRAAKGKARQGMAQATYAGRAKTSNAVDLLAAGAGSESDDIWTGGGKSAAKKRKPAAKRRKSTMNVDGDFGAETGAQKAKPKKGKSKAIETLVIGDTEDELSGGSRKGDLSLQGVIQVAATASEGTNQESKTPEDELHGTIAVSNALEEYKPPANETGVKKVHRWGRPKFLDEPIDRDDSSLTLGAVGGPSAVGTVVTDQPAALDPLVAAEQESEMLSELAKPTKKTTPVAKRRKSRKDESEEEDWTGDPEPTRKPAAKKETKAKTPRVTKKAAAAAAAAAAKDAEEQEKLQFPHETIKDSGDSGEDLAPTAIIAEPGPEKQIPTPELTKKITKKVPAKKEAKPKKTAKAIVTSKETVSDTDDEDDEKKDNSTPVPDPKSEIRKEEPQTPSKKLAEKGKKTPHSPINKGPVKFRVGLSRRAHIEPLLKIIRK